MHDETERQDDHGNTWEQEIDQPKIISEYMAHFGIIDRINRYRHFSIDLDRSWKTKKPELAMEIQCLGIALQTAYVAKVYCLPSTGPIADFLSSLAKCPEPALAIIRSPSEAGEFFGSPTRDASSALLTMQQDVGRRSPRRVSVVGIHVCILSPLVFPKKTKGKKQAGGYHRQKWCACCKRYKTQYLCRHCKQYICREGAFNRGVDLGERTCWQDHITYGVPQGHGKCRIGAWCADYEAVLAKASAKAARKRPRISLGAADAGRV